MWWRGFSKKNPLFAFSTIENKQKAGQLVKEFIEDAREEVKQEKQKMSEGIEDVWFIICDLAYHLGIIKFIFYLVLS